VRQVGYLQRLKCVRISIDNG